MWVALGVALAGLALLAIGHELSDIRNSIESVERAFREGLRELDERNEVGPK